MSFLPNKPNLNVESNDWTFKGWFRSIWDYFLGLSNVGVVQTASFTCSQDIYFYPCSTSGGAITVTLPPAIDCLGKQYTIGHVSGATDIAVALSGSDTVIPATSTTVALNAAATYISDGNSIWYQVSSGGGSSGGATSPLTTKGDMWVYSVADTRLPVGTDKWALTPASGETTGLKWVVPGSRIPIQTIASASGAYVFDLDAFSGAIINLASNITVTFSGGGDMQIFRMRIKQPVGGGCSVTMGSGVVFGTDLTGYGANTNPSMTDYVAVQYNAVANNYAVVSYTRGY